MSKETENVSKDDSTFSKPVNPIIVENISPKIFKNSIKLTGLIKRGKTNVRVYSIKPIRKSAILIFPYDEHSAYIIIPSWAQDTEVGTPKPRHPKERNKPSFTIVMWGKPGKKKNVI